MINNPKLINQANKEIYTLTYEQITEVIRKVDMEEDIKIIKNLISYLQEKISNGEDKIFYNELMWDEKTIDCINALEDIVQAYKEDEAVIKEMAEFMNKRSWKEHQLKDEDCHCCKVEYGSDECVNCIKEYFRGKVKDGI